MAYSELNIPKRSHHCGFKIDNSIFSIGGLGINGVLNDFIEINIVTRDQRQADVDGAVPKVYGAAVAPVFYESKMEPGGILKMKNIQGEINWAEAIVFIKQEGFYMFGGRDSNSKATNDLTIFTLKDEQRFTFKALKPETIGRSPPPRYMHSMDFIPKICMVAIFGGRDDNSMRCPVLDDLWLIGLHNLQYIEVKLGGKINPTPRCGHSTYVNGSELIICGGIDNCFKYRKDMQFFELSQDQVTKTTPLQSDHQFLSIPF